MNGVIIWAAGAAAIYAFYRRSGIDENEPRTGTALFAAGWPILVPVGIVWMGLHKLLDR